MSPPAPPAAGIAHAGGGSALVVGGAVLDILAHADDGPLPGTSNPGRIVTAPGGVAHNVASAIARLGTPTRLLAALGDDAAGREIREALRECGVDTSLVVTSSHPTGRYAAILDPRGELAVAVADLRATEALGGPWLTGPIASLGSADLLVLEANLSAEALVEALNVAADVGARVIVDPVSAAKAARLGRALGATPGRPPWLLTPNLDELGALLGAPVPEREAAEASGRLLARGLTHVWVRLGVAGGLLVSAHEGRRPSVVRLPAPPTTLLNVTGAGDAATAGFAHAWLAGASPPEAAAYGHECAAATVASEHTVRPDLLAVVGPLPANGTRP